MLSREVSQHFNLRTPTAADFNRTNQAYVCEVPNTCADVPALQAALTAKLPVDANHNPIRLFHPVVSLSGHKTDPVPQRIPEHCRCPGTH